jgi:hypothetical protein
MPGHYLQSLLGERETIILTTRHHWFILASSIVLELFLILIIFTLTLVGSITLLSTITCSVSLDCSDLLVAYHHCWNPGCAQLDESRLSPTNRRCTDFRYIQ